MAGEKQMVPGFNHNVKHKGTPYHVQTEDSGTENPRIITHLFVGGNVIASKKTSYADIVGAENLSQVVRELMEEQHKEMLRNLISGVYDDTEQEVAAKARAFQPGQIESQPARTGGARAPAPLEAGRAVAPAPASAPRAEAPRPADAARAPAARPPPIPRPANAARQFAAAGQAPERRPGREPQVPGWPATPAAVPAPQPGRAASAPRASAPAPALARAGAPAPARPRHGGEAPFGEDLISEKSLDEVILSYLAEDRAEKT